MLRQGDAMTAISLKLPDELARKSTEAAEKMGISRAELIRVALEHELADIGKRLERADMVKAVEAMREDPDYERVSASLDQGLMEDLPNEPENWWQG
jgi:metal-responsive CopG/Arc/MetJ family transcriptional regulator